MPVFKLINLKSFFFFKVDCHPTFIDKNDINKHSGQKNLMVFTASVQKGQNETYHQHVKSAACATNVPHNPLEFMQPHRTISPTNNPKNSPEIAVRKRTRPLLCQDNCSSCEYPCNKKWKETNSEGKDRPTLHFPSAKESSILYSPLDRCSAAVIQKHIRDTRCESFLHPLLSIVNRLMAHRSNRNFFNAPVDPEKLQIPHYFAIIQHPMDLSTVKTKCIQLEYATPEECATDIRLVFSNACLFNPTGHMVHEAAKRILTDFEADYARYQLKQRLKTKRRDQHSCSSCLSNVCGICLEKCIHFEPPLLICIGPCRQRIKRYAIYYRTLDSKHHWCAKCFTTLPKWIEVDNTQDRSIAKCELIKDKFTDKVTEPWVQCDECNGWAHQVCSLFNAAVNNDNRQKMTPYVCPLCRQKRLEKVNGGDEMGIEEYGIDSMSVDESSVETSEIFKHGCNPEQTDFCGSDIMEHETGLLNGFARSNCLKETSLSKFMETWIMDRFSRMGESELAESITVRVVSSIKTNHKIPEAVRLHFGTKNLKYPDQVEYTSKAICVFQRINKIEVCIFFMYVQEYDHQCSLVFNRNRVYLAYIDSLIYMRPRRIRTALYQEILLSYFAFCKERGYMWIHIWACPTTRGGDFIYWCHPTSQKNPAKERLQKWYLQMVERGQQVGVIASCDDLYGTEFETLEETLRNEVKLPPLFDGDFWPAQVELLLKYPGKRGRGSSASLEVQMHRDTIRSRVVDSVQACRDSLFVISLVRKRVEDSYLDQVEIPDISCTFLDYRTDMLRNSEQAHYQFDTFRRAKYSTMMLMYEVHKCQVCRS